MSLEFKEVRYEPRGRGFNSCQPHQSNNPEAKMLQGFFVSGLKSLIYMDVWLDKGPMQPWKRAEFLEKCDP